ncbi:hypothetical protein FG386_003575 [Cryptosporidium ryanae]|uniref:uncharacterized protein n=1 Tax=Cryptosporidium ryanae TaxID=515981 RepID=UPI00351A35B9|nr:hypothetical protein FG386_003575 [Cryptosporidium ryanae]
MKVFNVLKCLILLIVCMLFLDNNEKMNLKENSLIKLRKPRCKKLSRKERSDLEKQVGILQQKLGEKEIKGDKNGAENIRDRIRRANERLCKDN